MDKVINLWIPHVGEQIFSNIDTLQAVQFLQVSKAWRVIAEKVLNTKDRHGRNAFYLACKNGNDHHVRLMLENSDNIDVDARRNSGWTPFFRACRYGQTSIVSMLLDHADTKRIDLNVSKNSWFITPFAVACYFGHKDVAKLLLDYKGKTRIDFNARNKKKKTPFIRACETGSAEVVKLLLDYATEKKLDCSHPMRVYGYFQRPIADILFHVKPCLYSGNWRFRIGWAVTESCGSSKEDLIKVLLEFSEKKDAANHAENVKIAFEKACENEVGASSPVY